jgi:hypothetical protein
MAGMAGTVDHGDITVQGVPVDDGPSDTEGVTKRTDIVAIHLEAPCRRVAPLRPAVSAQVQVDHLRCLRQPAEVGLEVGVVVAPGPAVQEHDGGRSSIAGPSGTSAGPSTSNQSRVPFTSTCMRLLTAETMLRSRV